MAARVKTTLALSDADREENRRPFVWEGVSTVFGIAFRVFSSSDGKCAGYEMHEREK